MIKKMVSFQALQCHVKFLNQVHQQKTKSQGDVDQKTDTGTII